MEGQVDGEPRPVGTKDTELADLQAMCRRTLGFENHFLEVYEQFLGE